MKNIKEVMRSCAKLYYWSQIAGLKLVRIIGKKFGYNDFTCNTLIPYTQAVEKTSNLYVTYNLYPKASIDCNDVLEYRFSGNEEVAIVIQGPLLLEQNFTLELVRFYKKRYCGAGVIISTWIGEDERTIEAIKAENVEVILNEKPRDRGPSNGNLQAFSSYKGAERAMELGYKYVFKTRSDIRVTASDAISKMYWLVKNFPCCSPFQNARIIVFHAMMFQPYHPSDFFLFGDVEDVVKFYSYTVPSIEEKYFGIYEGTYRTKFIHPYGEPVGCMEYFKKKHSGWLECNIQAWWDDIKESLITLTYDDLKPLWIKYDYNHEESWVWGDYTRTIYGESGIFFSTFDLSKWLDLVNDLWYLNENDYEYLLDKIYK